VYKDSLRVQAYGTVDELSSHIGLAVACGLSHKLEEVLLEIQHELLHLGADLSFLEEDKEKYPVPTIEKRHVARLTTLVEELAAFVGPLGNFILPGGAMGAAQLHVARTVCRRAERLVTSLAREEPVNERVIPYLNRLSDVLFLMARYENKLKNKPDRLWDTSA
jgi:cob(I)alamin adenosyltransferase